LEGWEGEERIEINITSVWHCIRDCCRTKLRFINFMLRQSWEYIEKEMSTKHYEWYINLFFKIQI
jgi:hypothetical protein